MIERHGPELRRAHLLLRPFYYADKTVMDDTLANTNFGVGIDDKTDRPSTLIMDQQLIPDPVYTGVSAEADDAIALVRERAEKLLVDHGLVADIYDANGNIRMRPDNTPVLVDVSFGSVQDRRQLLVPTQPPQTELQIARIRGAAVPNIGHVGYNEA